MEDLGSRRLHFIFFFSFLFFSLFSFSVSVVLDYIILHLFFLFSVLFSGHGCCRFEQKLNAEFHSFQITTWNV